MAALFRLAILRRFILLLVAVVPRPNRRLKKPRFFFGWRLLARRRLTVGRLNGSSAGSGLNHAIGVGVAGAPGRRAQSQDLGEKATIIGEGLVAGLLRLRPGDERDRISLGAGRRRQQIGDLVHRSTTTPYGAEKFFVSEYCGTLTARFMNSAQMGAAAAPPASLISV